MIFTVLSEVGSHKINWILDPYSFYIYDSEDKAMGSQVTSGKYFKKTNKGN